MNRTLSLLFAVLLLVTMGAARAHAQEGGQPLHLGAGMVVDFAGEADYDRDFNGRNYDDDLEATVGLRLHGDYEVARYVSVGGFTRLTWWEGEDVFEERNMLFDIGPRIQGKYDWRDFRFYVAGMPGLMISKMNNDFDWIDNPAVGFTMSIAPGVEYWFNSDIAVYTEIFGWVGHYFEHETENPRAYRDLDIDMNQVAFNFGIVFAP